MATKANPRTRRPQVTPSLVKSETFLFALLIVGFALYVPYMFKTGRGSEMRYANSTTTAPIHVVNVPDALGASRPPLSAPPRSGAGVPPEVSGQLGTQSGEQRTAPISYIVPYILAVGRSILSFIARLPVFIYRLVVAAIIRPLAYPLALILAILRPVTLLLEVIYDVFLRIPLAVLSWFFREAIYPLSVLISSSLKLELNSSFSFIPTNRYIFTGIAAILGVTFGYSASHVPRAAIFATEHIRSRISQAPAEQPGLLVQPPSDANSLRQEPTYSSSGGSFRKRPSLGGPSRSVTFDDTDDVQRYY